MGEVAAGQQHCGARSERDEDDDVVAKEERGGHQRSEADDRSDGSNQGKALLGAMTLG